VKPFIIAEISGNHNGSLETAHRLVEAVSESGADAVKFQTFKPEQMGDETLINAGPWKGERLIDVYKRAYTPWEWLPELFTKAKTLDLIPFSSPFSAEAVDYLETLDCPIYKIASFELIDLELIRYAAGTGKKMVLSTGMATEDEIQDAIHAAGKPTLLKCTSAYPAPDAEINLLTIRNMMRFGYPVGISDHSLGHSIPLAAIALGAQLIEKHITLDKNTIDGAFSLLPKEFKQMVTECHRVSAALGQVHYGPTESEQPYIELRQKRLEMRYARH
jgi:N-acetylneuraminate synthase